MNEVTDPRSPLRDFRRPALWVGIWVFGWILCIVLSLIHPPRIDLHVPDGDKVGHFLAYGTLAAWSVMLFARRRDHWLAALALVLLGIAMELAQGAFTSDRMMDSQDALADALGVLFAQLLVFTRARFLLQRFDGTAP